MFEDPYGVSPEVSSAAFKRKFLVFVTTALAVLLGLSLVFPLTVKEYQSIVSIAVTKSPAVKTVEELRPLLAHAIREELQSTDLVKQAQLATEKERSETKDSFQFAVQDAEESYLLQVAINGQATPAQMEVVETLAERVAYRFSTGRGSGNSEADGQFQMALKKYRSGGSHSDNDFEEAEWLLSQAEQDIDQIKQKVGRNSNSSNGLSLNNEGSGYHLASTQKLVGNQAENFGQALDSIDLASLKQVIGRLKEQSQSPGGALEPFRVVGLTKTQNNPINGMPNLGGLLLMLATSGLVASIIAWHYNPFIRRGFADMHEVSRKLDAPIAGMIKVSTAPEAGEESTWANRIYQWATWFLVIGLACAVLLLLLNSTVRDAFIRNPFYGLSEMLRVLTGR